jgi:2',3'-cyclic-nucleotide 2'-phosphodiesterase (5'-nucleotidase family)
MSRRHWWLSSASAALLGILTVAGCTRSTNRAPPTPVAKEDAPKQVTILYVADLHAQLTSHPELFRRDGGEWVERAGGFARVAEAVRKIREERGGEVLVLDAGDTIQGSGIAVATEGKALVPALNAIGFDAAIPGNWEVVYGVPALRARQAELRYPMFASNILTSADRSRPFASAFVKEVSGLKVAVVGFTDPDVPLRQPPGYSAGFTYEGTEALDRELAAVKARENPDVLLVLSHVGLHKAVAMSERLKAQGVAAHLSGDTHERTYRPIERDGMWTVEPGGFGSFLGRLDLWVKDGQVVDKQWELIELTEKAWGEDPKVAALVDEAVASHPELREPVGHVAQQLMRYDVVETSLDRVIADAVRAEAKTDIALSNGFRFGFPLPPGPVTRDDLWTVLPINSRLKVGTVTGRQLRTFFEKEIENVFSPDAEKRFGGWLPRPSGMTVRFDPEAKKGSRLRELKVAGVEVKDDQRYTIAACEREGDAPDTLCRMPHVESPRVLDLDIHQAVAKYLNQQGRVDGSLAGPPRVVAEGAPRPLRTQLKELEKQ